MRNVTPEQVAMAEQHRRGELPDRIEGALGELAGVSLGVLGDAQLVLAAVAAGIAAAVVGIAEGPTKG